jgi:hypothetical protein
MPAYSGTALVVNWLYGAGTILLSGDYTQFAYNPAIELLDETAGADPAQLFIAGLKSGQAQLTTKMQSGTGAGGTLMTSSLNEGNFGTLIVNPVGTAAGAQKMTIPAFSGGAQWNFPFKEIVEISASFTQSGVRTDGTN